MARPDNLVTGRQRPSGSLNDPRLGKKASAGLTFTRIPRVRRLRSFAAAPRPVLTIGEAEDTTEARYQQWYSIYGGTRPEWIVFDYLTNVKKWRQGDQFVFQSSQFGGRQRLGGSVVDFEIIELNMFWRVQGERFHLINTEAIGRDLLQKLSLSRQGWAVVDLYAEDLLSAPRRTIELALKGEQVKTPRGTV